MINWVGSHEEVVLLMSMLQPPPCYAPSHGAPTLSSAMLPSCAIINTPGATWSYMGPKER